MQAHTADRQYEVLRTDPVYRKRLFLAYGVCVLAGVAATWFGVPRFMRYLAAQPFSHAVRTVELVAVGFILSFTVPALYLINVGRTVLRHSAFPYPGMKVIRDTRVRTGDSARKLGKFLVGLGIFAIFTALAGSARTYYMFEKMRLDPLIRMRDRVAPPKRQEPGQVTWTGPVGCVGSIDSFPVARKQQQADVGDA